MTFHLPHAQEVEAALAREDAVRVRLADAIAASNDAAEQATEGAMATIAALLPRHDREARYACRTGYHERCPGGSCPCPHHTEEKPHD